MQSVCKNGPNYPLTGAEVTLGAAGIAANKSPLFVLLLYFFFVLFEEEDVVQFCLL